MTSWHPLDGNMIAADRYYDRPSFEEGDCCPHCKEGKLAWHMPDCDDGAESEEILLCDNCLGEVE